MLPRFASSPVRDPRAPQNLTPVGADAAGSADAEIIPLSATRKTIARRVTAWEG